MKHSAVKIASLCTIVAVACGFSPHSTETQVRKALNAHLEVSKVCLGPALSFPVTLLHGNGSNTERRKKLAYLERLGLVEATQGAFKAHGGLAPGFLRARPKKGTTWRLTKLGKVYASGRQLCFAARRMEELIDYSAPADFFGKKITEARFSYSLVRLARWARSHESRVQLPEVAAALNRDYPAKGTALLLLTNQGWRVERIQLSRPRP